jgi:hypothetical protein
MQIRTAALVILALASCKDSGKESATRAGEHAAFLAKTAEVDVAEIERGLPEGARRLSALFAKGSDPRQDLPGVRTALQRLRKDVMDLNRAKSTFFALADETGKVIRNDLEEDRMAGMSLASAFPEVAKAKDKDFMTTVGAFKEALEAKPPDKDFLATAAVKKEDGTVGALFVTGWSYRAYARRLNEALKSDLIDKARAAGNENRVPVFYVGIFDKSGVYMAKPAPEVNEKAMADADLVGKTASGAFTGTTTITDRTYGYGAVRVPKLGPETGIVVLRSEI